MSQYNKDTPSSSYLQLDKTVSGSFRLVILHPGSFHNPGICDLTQDTWQREDIKYEALSYAWGDGRIERPIQLNGQSFLVTATLHSALSYLRYQDELRALWVDAICINQESIQERNHQVQFMGQIYRNSKRVVVWLGESDDDSDDAVFFINSLYDVLGFRISWTAMKWLKNPTVTSYLEPPFMHLWQSVCRLLQPQWWKRAWIVQELINGREVIFQIGSKNLDLEPMAVFVSFIQSTRSESPSPQGHS